jgi:hypothetical protein
MIYVCPPDEPYAGTPGAAARLRALAMAYQRSRGEGGMTQLARLKGTTLGHGNVLCEGFSRNGRFSLQWAQVAQ